eukprot:Amastigsp_a339756_108.p2 type:complete len:105 gc:universal Amastigsp_a339756_108:347-33(-)
MLELLSERVRVRRLDVDVSDVALLRYGRLEHLHELLVFVHFTHVARVLGLSAVHRAHRCFVACKFIRRQGNRARRRRRVAARRARAGRRRRRRRSAATNALASS